MPSKCECGCDQVPGQTITRSEYSDILNDAVKTSGYGDDWERGFCSGLSVAGMKVTPDPEPEPDPEEVKRLAGALEEAASTGWVMWSELAAKAMKHGVMVGDDDEG